MVRGIQNSKGIFQQLNLVQMLKAYYMMHVLLPHQPMQPIMQYIITLLFIGYSNKVILIM